MPISGILISVGPAAKGKEQANVSDISRIGFADWPMRKTLGLSH